MENEEVVGNIILRVHEDLNHLHEKLSLKQGQGQVDVNDIKDLLTSTQQGLKKRAEEILNQINNQVTSYSNLHPVRRREQSSSLSSINQERFQRIQAAETLKSNELIPIEYISPGEMMKRELALRSVSNPFNRLNRKFANEKFGIQLPLIQEKNNYKTTSNDNLQRGSVVQRLEKLPLETNKHFNISKVSKITELDAQRGLMNLIERGLIPPNARITFEPPPIQRTTIPLLSQSAKLRVNVPAGANEQGFSGSAYQLDNDSNDLCDYMDEEGENKASLIKNNTTSTSQAIVPVFDHKITRNKTGNSVVATKLSILHSKKEKIQKSNKVIQFNKEVEEKEIANAVDDNADRQEIMPPPTTPASQLSKSNMESYHKFTITNGKIREFSDDFIKFKRHYCLVWGSIVTIVQSLEELLLKFSTPIAFINGDRVADLSVEYEMELKPTDQELLNCIINKEDVLKLMKKAGRRFLGENGREVAAIKIQSVWRGYVERKSYLEYRRKRCAAGVIAIKWILHMKMAHINHILRNNRIKYLNNFKKRQQILSSNWKKISSNRRIIIHLPSMGIDEKLRKTIKKLPELQNHQMTRLCDIRDPNVDVIYISPVPVNDEMLQYFSKLLALKSAIDTGNVNDQKTLDTRYKIIVPEAVKSFPNHNMCLSTILKYSPRALQRIKHLIKGRVSWIVPGIMNIDDLEVADKLGVPILGTEPETLNHFNSKSGIRKMLENAKVKTCHGEGGIVSLNQLYESLAQLITDNLDIKRWILKVNNEIRSCGIGYIDIDQHLSCYKWAQKEQKRYGDRWHKRWAQENAYNRILGEIQKIIETNLITVDQKRFLSGSRFISEFINQGGVIEAYPSSDSVTNITVSMFIDPTGQIEILGSGDQIHDGNSLNAWGYSVPQSSIDAEVLNEACIKIAQECRINQIKGYFSIDFVTFVEEDMEESQILWAIDIDFHYSDMASLTNLLLFSTNAFFLPSDHNLTVEVPNKQNELSPLVPRYACLSTQLSHSNLGMVHYSVFFQMCRAHGIGFDIKEKQGTIFSLIDCFNRENITMITIGPTLEYTLESFAKNLYVLHQEISSANMQGKGNFKVVIKEIENILGLAIENTILAESKAS